VGEFVPKVLIRDANRPPWIDREVLQLIRKKNRIRRKAKRLCVLSYGPDSAGLDSLLGEWLNLRSVITCAILVLPPGLMSCRLCRYMWGINEMWAL